MTSNSQCFCRIIVDFNQFLITVFVIPNLYFLHSNYWTIIFFQSYANHCFRTIVIPNGIIIQNVSKCIIYWWNLLHEKALKAKKKYKIPFFQNGNFSQIFGYTKQIKNKKLGTLHVITLTTLNECAELNSRERVRKGIIKREWKQIENT